MIMINWKLRLKLLKMEVDNERLKVEVGAGVRGVEDTLSIKS